MDEKSLLNFNRAIKSSATRIVYLHRIGEFKTFLKAKTYDAILKGQAKNIEDKIALYVDSLKAKKLSARTIKVCMSAIKLFYVSNRVALNWEWLHALLPSVDAITEDRLYTKEELHKILAKCDERKRVMFLILYSSGMRIGALHLLKVRDLTKIEKYGIYQVKVYAGTTQNYTSFTTPECAQAIDGYLEYRKNKGETILPSAPLIRKQFSVPNNVEPMTLGSTISLLDDLLHDAGVRTKGERLKRKNVMRFHAWRKATNTAMINAGVTHTAKELILGHGVGLDNSYYRQQDSDLLDQYVKAISALTVSDEPKLQAEVAKLKIETGNVEGLRQELKQRDEWETRNVLPMLDAIKQMKAEIERLKAKSA